MFNLGFWDIYRFNLVRTSGLHNALLKIVQEIPAVSGTGVQPLQCMQNGRV